MESLTKTNVSKEQLEKIVENIVNNKIITGIESKEFKSIELKNGYFNKIYLLKFPNTEVIIKIAPNQRQGILRYERNVMEAEFQVLTKLQGEVEVKIPKIYHYDKSQNLVDFDYFLMEKMEGISMNEIEESLSEEVIEEIECNMGKANFEFNQIKGEKFGYVGQAHLQTDTWSEAFWQMLSDIMEDGKDAEVEIPYEEIKNEFLRFKPVFDEVEEPYLVHWDLWRGNVLIKDEKMIGIIDFERAVWGDPLFEYYFLDYVKSTGFTKGYGISREKFTENEMIRRTFYDLYFYIIQKVECYYRGYVDSMQYNWGSKNIISVLERIKTMKD